MTDHTMTAGELDAQYAVDKLTRPWSDVLSPRESGTGHYQPVDHKPLLDMLAEAKSSSLGGTTSGASADAERSLLNLQAFQEWNHIEGTVRAQLAELSRARFDESLKDATRRLFGQVRALHAVQQIPTDRYEHILGQFQRWVDRIWGMFDPPVVKELKGPCPHCGEVEYRTLEDAKTTALIAFYWKGIRPQAKCQRCGELWDGERALLELGYHLGATQDEATLRDMGIVS